MDGWLAGHLESWYGIRVAGTTALDRGVHRIDRQDGPSWVARVFPPNRPIDEVRGDAAVLRMLERGRFPAERCATPTPVSTHDGRSVLVTGFVDGPPAPADRRTFARLGHLLGHLHRDPATHVRPGGAWHHLAPGGGPTEELAAARALLEDVKGADDLRVRLAEADDCADLPQALVHPDPVPLNAIATEDGLVVVDWTNAGRGPRLWSLGLLLWAAGARDPRLVDAVVTRYRRLVALEPAELARLDGAIRVRPLVMDAWAVGTGRNAMRDVRDGLAEADRITATVAERARAAFTAPAEV